MTTDKLYEFLVLSATLSFSRAAKELFMTQSALSRHIKEMEEELGAQLFERSTHGVRRTEAGRYLAQSAQPLLDKYNAALARLRVVGLDVTGAVAIACAERSVYDPFLAFVRQFGLKYGGISCDISVFSGGEDHAALLQTQDLLFSAFALRDLPPEISALPAFRDPGVLVTPYGHTLQFQHRVALEELTGKTLFLPYAERTDCSYGKIAALVRRHTGGKVDIVNAATPESALLMVSLGRGFAIVPRHMTNAAAEDIAMLSISSKGCVFDTYLYWNAARENPAARLFYEEFKSFLSASQS